MYQADLFVITDCIKTPKPTMIRRQVSIHWMRRKINQLNMIC